MPEEYITREVHNEFAKRVEEENARQNHRLTQLETDVKDNRKLTTSVEILAKSVERIAKEQEQISARLTRIEEEPAENWKKAVWLVVTALISAAVGYFIRG